MTLTVENGSFTYPHSEQAVLNKINFSVNTGDVLAILGPNGAGKTTMLRCTMGLLKWRDGKSLLGGKDIRSIPGKRLWSDISYVPQARQASSAYTIEEMVLLGRSSEIGLFSLPGKKDIQISEEVMKHFGLWDKRHKNCSEISGGELQMVLIARALASKPKVLILDEPESNLDFKNQLLVLDTMSDLASKGMTCIFNTHYPAHALRRANKSLLLTPGGDYVFGSTREVITEESIGRAFGVQAVIGNIETPGNIYQDIVPVSIGKSNTNCCGLGYDKRVIATISVILSDFSAADKINAILHTYNRYLVGRMGMPYRRAGVNIINVTLDSPMSVVQEIVDELNLIPSVSVKATYAKELNID